MSIIPEYTNEKSCRNNGFYWYEGSCHTSTYAVEKGLLGDWFDDTSREIDRRLQFLKLFDVGEGPFDWWTTLVNSPPPEGTIQRFFWQFGILIQLLLSVVTFPAGMAAFLLEEAVQAESMGAFMLSSSKAYDQLEPYAQKMIEHIDTMDTAVDGVALFSPLIGGAVINYLQSARKTARVFKQMATYNLAKEEQELKTKLDKATTKSITMELRLESSPSSADIWINDSNTGLITPETLTFDTDGTRTITLMKYDRQDEGWRVYSFTQPYTPGYRVEKMVNLPADVIGEDDEGDYSEETVTQISPTFVNSEVTGDIAVDGDTFFTVGGEKVRVIGIDAPELGRPFGDEAKAALQKAIEDKKLTLKIQSHKVMDVYGRILAEVRNYEGNIGVSLLSSGLAKQLWDKEDYFDTTRYEAAEKTAQERKIGIWESL